MAHLIVRETMTDEYHEWCDHYGRKPQQKRRARRAGRRIEKRAWKAEVR